MTTRAGWVSCSLLAIVVGLAPAVSGQSEECKDAFDFASEVREALAKSPARADVEKLHYRVTSRTQACKTLTGLWLLRAQLADMLGDRADSTLARDSSRSPYNLNDVEFRALLASANRAGFNPSKAVRKHWAFLVGTGEFKDRNIRSLKFVSNDLRGMTELMTSTLGYPRDNVFSLSGSEFTLENYRRSFARLRDSVEEDDEVIVYLASHGYEGPDDANNESILLTYDSDTSNTQSRYVTGLSVAQLAQEVFSQLKARKIVLIIDACFSGDAITGQRSPAGQVSPIFLSQLTQGSGRVVISASTADQQSYELDSRQHGAFTYCFMDAVLRNPAVTVGEHFAATKACVEIEVKAIAKQQSPSIFASDGARQMSLK